MSLSRSSFDGTAQNVRFGISPDFDRVSIQLPPLDHGWINHIEGLGRNSYLYSAIVQRDHTEVVQVFTNPWVFGPIS